MKIKMKVRPHTILWGMLHASRPVRNVAPQGAEFPSKPLENEPIPWQMSSIGVRGKSDDSMENHLPQGSHRIVWGIYPLTRSAETPKKASAARCGIPTKSSAQSTDPAKNRPTQGMGTLHHRRGNQLIL